LPKPAARPRSTNPFSGSQSASDGEDFNLKFDCLPLNGGDDAKALTDATCPSMPPLKRLNSSGLNEFRHGG
jgi:hypothetical protein